MSMKSLTFITGNLNKVAQLGKYLNFEVKHATLDIPEIQSLDVEEVATAKAEAAYALLGTPVLVEDVTLTFDALNGLPGPLVKWFLESIGTTGLTKLLTGYENRSATAEVCFALRDESGVHLFTGTRQGSIADTPRGETAFGWNPIFIPEGKEKTWAEMNDDEQRETSMRRLALEKLQVYLDAHYR